MQLKEVKFICFDEADTLCDSFYEKDCSVILENLKNSARDFQVTSSERVRLNTFVRVNVLGSQKRR